MEAALSLQIGARGPGGPYGVVIIQAAQNTKKKFMPISKKFLKKSQKNPKNETKNRPSELKNLKLLAQIGTGMRVLPL